MNTEMLADISFWLRQGNALELLFCGAVLMLIYSYFKNRLIRRFLWWAIIWFVSYAVARAATPLIDFYANQGYGISSLTINVIFWLVPCLLLTILLVKIKRGTVSMSRLSATTDKIFDEAFQELRENMRRTDKLYADMKGKSTK